MTRAARSVPPLTLALGAGGLVPFVIFSVVLYAPLPAAEIELARGLLLTYAAVILSFLGAVHWGLALARTEAGQEPDGLALLWGVTPSLIGWLALMFPPRLAASILIAGFVAQWLMDRARAVQLGAPAWYLRLRSGLSVGVLFCLSLALLRG